MSEQVKATKTETTMRADSELGDEGTRDLAARITKFCDEYVQMRGMDPDLVYGIHLGDERAAEVRVSDLRALVALVEAARTELAASRYDLRLAEERGDSWRSLVKEDTVELERLRDALADLSAATYHGNAFVAPGADTLRLIAAEERAQELLADNAQNRRVG